MGQELEQELSAEKMASLRQLAYGASHEINNPLGNIASRAQMLAERQTDPELKRHLATIYQQAMRAHEMISDMMLFAHPPAMQIRSIQLDKFVTAIEKAFPSFPDRLQFRLETDITSFDGDFDQWIEAVAAVIQNSIEADADANPIQVCFKNPDPNCLEIQVDDAGPGVSQEVQRHMFDPFYSGREAGRGLGFGLSKAWTIAKLHDGKLQIVKKQEPGCRMLFSIPIT